MESVINKVYNTVMSEGMISSGDKVLVGLSGGADSVFLLESLLSIRESINFEIACAHLNHGIRGDEAFRDQEFCRELCSQKNIRFFHEKCNIPILAAKRKISEETCGREERYKFFNRISLEYGFNKIAVAHNMNDSVETIILNMIRGASLKGLSGIEHVNGLIIRPIINVTRHEIEEYMHKHNSDYCIDSTNLTTEYTRNRIRHLILEEMKIINPSVINTIHTNACNIRDDDDFISTYADSLNCITKQNDEVCVDKNTFDNQHIAIKKRILINAFIAVNGNAANIGNSHIEILLGNLKSGKKYDMPNGITVYISFDKIVFTKIKACNSCLQCDFTIGIPVDFNNNVINSCFTDEISIMDENSIYLDYDKLKNRRLILRSRKEGDKFIPYGMNHSKKIKQFMSEIKIPSNARNNVPILCVDEEIAAVIPYRISDNYKVTEHTGKILKITQEKKENE